MIAACCVKSAQTVNRMRALVDEGITEKDWTEALIKKSFEEPIPAKPEDTPLTRGEFDIVKALLAKCPEVGVGKILVDKMVDLAGPGEEGAGGTHLRCILHFILTKIVSIFHVANFFTFCLRHCVPEFQKKMDAASGDEQLLLKKKLLNSLERYFYLVCFGAYCRLEGNVKTLRV